MGQLSGTAGDRKIPAGALRRWHVRPPPAPEVAPVWPGAALPADLPADVGFLLAHGFEEAVLHAAVARAERFGVAPAEVLISHGIVGEAAYYRALAGFLKAGFLDEGALRRQAARRPAANAAVIRHGRLIALEGNAIGRGGAVAPQGAEVAELIRLLQQKPHLGGQIRITTPTAIRKVLTDAAGERLTASALARLAGMSGDFSARTVLSRAQLASIGAGGAGLAALFLLLPGAATVGVNLLLTAVFLSVVAVRILAALAPEQGLQRPRRTADEKLPVYTILVPLHDEAGMVEGLVAALRALDYPPERLDIKLVVEADDAATRAAIGRLRLGAPFEEVVVPPSQPRTKPKALSFALPLARGRFVVVYDAEDRPEPDQLRRAVAAFGRGGARLGCLQAWLDITPADGGTWLTDQFAAEYAAQFHVLLPFLARHGLPLPLGGTSNHFRREVLEQIGGWDPFNVTEDADIGQRLARFGYRASVIASGTGEAAPGRLGIWLKQRTRWMKGWMQTYLVHMRAPGRLLRELGPTGFIALQVMIGGVVLSALIHPFFLVASALTLGGLFDVVSANGLFGRFLLGIDGFNLVAGYAAGIAIASIGLERRGAAMGLWRLVTLPAYWLLISAAAYRAVYQLWRDPFLWEKTPHTPDI